MRNLRELLEQLLLGRIRLDRLNIKTVDHHVLRIEMVETQGTGYHFGLHFLDQTLARSRAYEKKKLVLRKCVGSIGAGMNAERLQQRRRGNLGDPHKWR